MSAAKNLSIRLAAVGGDKVRQEFKALGNDGQKAFRQITNVITPANDNLLRLSENTKIFNGILKQASYLAGAFLGFKGVSGTLGALFESNRSFEQLSASLKTVTGSVEGAQAAFALIEKFAVDTPYQLNEIVEAFIRLKALGLDSLMMREMRLGIGLFWVQRVIRQLKIHLFDLLSFIRFLWDAMKFVWYV